jgi:polyisoprenoid-binding protein YceI
MRLFPSLALGALGAWAAPAAIAAPETYQLEPTHVDVLFAINHLGFSMKHGSFRAIAGTLAFDKDHPEASEVTITIKADSVDTSFAARDTDLKGEKFLDAAKFPEIRFHSTRITALGAGRFRVAGDLTLHGVTRPIELDARLNGVGPNPFDKKPTVGVSVTGSLKRSDFGMGFLTPMIGDEVTIAADAEFNQPAPAAPKG